MRARLVSLIAAGLLISPAACSSDDAANRHTAIPGQALAEPVQPSPEDAAQNAPSAVPGASRLTADAAKSYFGDGVAAKAAERFALEDWAGAADGFVAALAALSDKASPATRGHYDLMIGLCRANQSQWAAAATHLDKALAALPEIADFIRYQAARANYFARDTKKALALARAVAADSISGADAELLVGDLLRGSGDHKAIGAHYEKYLADRPAGIRRSEVRYRIAEAAEAVRDFPTALAQYRTITISDPLSSWAEKATKQLAPHIKKMSKPERIAFETLTAAELIERGMVYYDAMRNPLSEADFSAALKAYGLTPEDKCVASYHLAQSAFKARDRTKAAPLFDAAFEACKAAANTDLTVKSAYQAGRSLAYLRNREDAIKRYQLAQTIDPTHSYNDDAMLREAEEYADLGDDAKVRATLAALPTKYPDGDMRAEALWRLAWRAYMAKDYDEALGWLDKQIKSVPLDDNYWAEGQPQYWKGRSYGHKGDKAAEIASYVEAVRLYPLSYYSLLALNRLRERDAKTFDLLMDEITGKGEKAAATGTIAFGDHPEYSTPGFARALEFLRLGLKQPAEAELAKVGLTPPAGKSRVDDPAQIQKLWAMAFLYDSIGQYELSHWSTRWHMLDYKRGWPVGANAIKWKIAYPWAFWPLLKHHADRHGFPGEMLMAIVREESAFDPLRESYANAIGLTQMIFVTADRFAKGTGIEPSRENLRDPEKNVTIGSNFLGFLFKKWNSFFALIPPSYNAGEGAVTRMLRARGHLDSDAWAESIVDDQARNYSKRVLSSFFTYTFLNSQTVPVMPLGIPKDLLPGK